MKLTYRLRPIQYLIIAAAFVLWGCSEPTTSDPEPVKTYALGVTLAGLNGSLGLSLSSPELASAESLVVSQNGSLNFDARLKTDSDITIDITSQPDEQICRFSANSSNQFTATLNEADLNVNLVCINKTYRTSVSVTGLNDTLRLALSSPELATAEPLEITNNGSFDFAASFETNSQVSIEITEQPDEQICSFSGDDGGPFSSTINSSDLNVQIVCIDKTYSINITVTGLDQANVMTVNLSSTGTTNVNEDLIFNADDDLSFNEQLTKGRSFKIEFSQPNNTAQNCVFNANNSTVFEGTMSNTALSLSITCTPTFSLGGNLSGALDTANLTVQLYQSETLVETLNETTLANNASFAFDKRLDLGSDYRVVVGTPPSDQLCSVTNGNGTLTSQVSDIVIQCLAWGGELRIDNTPNVTTPKAQVVLNKNGQATATWQSQETPAAPLNFREITYPDEQPGLWSASTQINQPGQGFSFPTQNPFTIAINDNGDSLAVWEPGRYNLRSNLGAWGEVALNVADSSGTTGISSKIDFPKAALNNRQDGEEAILVWTESSVVTENGTTTTTTNFYANTYNWPNQQWGATATQLNSSESKGTSFGAQQAADIASNDNGQALAIWPVLSAEGVSIDSALYTASGSKWQPTQTLWTRAEQPGVIPQPKIAINSADQAIAVWEEVTETEVAIWANSYRDGVWSEAIELEKYNVVIPLSAPPMPQVALNDQGQAVVVWSVANLTVDEVTSTHLYAQSYDFADQQWQQNAELLGQGPRTTPAPSLALANNGLAIVVWQQDGIDVEDHPVVTVQARGYSADTGCWCDEPLVIGTVNKFTVSTSLNPTVAINESNGEAIVVWSLYNDLSTTEDDEFAGIWANHFSIPSL